jgi:hypothetical protein
MISNFARVVTTAVIWLMLPVIVGMAGNSVEGFNMVMLVAIIGAAAAGSTVAIWNNRGQVVETQEEKAKRTGSYRVQRFVDHLSDDEVEELRARLGVDNQTVPLETLLARQREQR